MRVTYIKRKYFASILSLSRIYFYCNKASTHRAISVILFAFCCLRILLFQSKQHYRGVFILLFNITKIRFILRFTFKRQRCKRNHNFTTTLFSSYCHYLAKACDLQPCQRDTLVPVEVPPSSPVPWRLFEAGGIVGRTNYGILVAPKMAFRHRGNSDIIGLKVRPFSSCPLFMFFWCKI